MIASILCPRCGTKIRKFKDYMHMRNGRRELRGWAAECRNVRCSACLSGIVGRAVAQRGAIDSFIDQAKEVPA